MGSSNSTSFWRFDSPLIYLFGGITLILLLIVVALVMLACSERRRRRSAADVENGGESQKTASTVYNGGDGTDNTPKVVVIMAGDELPTYLATPVVVVAGAGDGQVSK